jgi:hypothetical protein
MKDQSAEDEPFFHHFLEKIVARWGYEAVVARDENEAWQTLRGEKAPGKGATFYFTPGYNESRPGG